MEEKYNINQTTLKIINSYSNNYRQSLHLRELARAVQIDAKAVGLQLKRLEDVNILASVTKGRNLDYHLNLENGVVKYYIIIAEIFSSIRLIESRFIIKKLINDLSKQVDGSIILFGSFAKGKETKNSDIDIMVLAENAHLYSSQLFRAKVSGIGTGIDREINIKSIDRDGLAQGLQKRDPLISEVLDNHILLKGAEDFCDILWDYYGGR